MPLRRRGDRPEDGSGDHAGHHVGNGSGIMAMAHPEDRADDHGRQDRRDHQDRPSWDEMLGRRALAVSASWR